MFRNVIKIIQILLWTSFVGFLFHTSQSRVVLNKYSISYFCFILIWLTGSLLFSKFTNPVVKIVKKISKNSKRNRQLFYAIVLLCAIMLSLLTLEYITRIMSNPSVKPTQLSIESFDPYLQNKPTKDRNIHINNIGFRGDDLPPEKKENVFRIFAVGGSTVLSSIVPYEKSHMKILENMLQKKYPDKKIEIYNAGENGYTTKHILILYLFKIKYLKPDLIITWNGFNDLNRICTAKPYATGNYEHDYSHYYGTTFNMLNTYYSDDFIKIKSRLLENAYEFFLNNFFSDLKFLFPKKEYHINYKGEIVNNFPPLSDYKNNMITFVDILKADNIPVIIGNQPYLFKNKMSQEEIDTLDGLLIPCLSDGGYPSVSSWKEGLIKINNETKQLSSEKSLDFVDLESNLPKNLTFFRDFVHTREKGDALIAKMLYDKIVAGGYIN